MTAGSYAVVIPAFNAGRTLRDAIDSVLVQTVPPAAIVVVDDGSTDDTAAIARGYGTQVTLISQENRGPAAATDLGLANVDATVIAGLDADDVWFPDKAALQLARLTAKLDIDGVFCRVSSFLHGTQASPSGNVRDMWGRSAMMIRRGAAERMGNIFQDENPRGLGEMIRWFDLGRQRGLVFEMMPEVLVGRRLIEGSLTSTRDPAALLPMLRARLRRRD